MIEGSSTGLALIDWAIIAVYATSMIFLGWYFGRKQTSTKECFIGSGTNGLDHARIAAIELG